MSTAIIHKKTAISGRLPTTSQLELGEIAINTYDGTLHIKKDDGSASIVTIGQIASIGDIGDVDTTTTSPTTGQVLKWDGTNWVPQNDIDTTLTLSAESIGSLGDVDITGITNGQILEWDSANSKFIAVTPVAGYSSTNFDTDFAGKTTTDLAEGLNLYYTDARADARIAAASIDDLSDVDTSTTSPTTGQALAWNGASWVPQTISGSGNTTYSEQTIVSDPYTGNGTQVDFSTSIVPQSEDSVMVMLNGVVQDPQTYSLLGDVVTFSTAPANGDNVELRTFSGFSTSVQLSNYYSYVYTLSSDATSVSGSDDNSQTLAYQIGKVEVYVNGVRLVDGDDYTATNTTSISFNETVFAGSVVEVVSLASAALLNEALQIQSSSQVLTTTTANQAVEVFDAATYGTAKFIVQMKHATAGIQSSEVLVTHDGSNAYFTVYGEIYSTAVLGTISADVNSGNVRLLVTPVNTNTTVKTKRISVEA